MGVCCCLTNLWGLPGGESRVGDSWEEEDARGAVGETGELGVVGVFGVFGDLGDADFPLSLEKIETILHVTKSPML